MEEKDDKQIVTDVARKVLGMMAKRDIPMYPENYLVWFEYCIGSHEDLKAHIDGLIEAQTPFTEEVNLQIYRRHFGQDKESVPVEQAQNEIQKILKGVLDEILYTQTFTSEYRDKLQQATADLEEARELTDIRGIVAGLMKDTVEVVQTGELLRTRLEETTRTSENLRQELQKAQREVLIDPLTELYNRKAFDRKIRDYIKAFQEEDRGFAMVMMDIDHFKQFNDQHGHLLGDQVLQLVGSFLSNELKGKDFAARYGGEEFVILLAGTPLDNAWAVANNIRKSLSEVKLKYVKTGQVIGRITVSCGIAAMRAGDTVETVVQRADDALYLAKNSGRNMVKSEADLPS